MAEESEKRFTAIMDKLFHAPPTSKPSSSSPRGKKWPNGGSGLGALEKKSRGNLVEKSQNHSDSMKGVKPLMCRPWDRGDFFRRLTTFKSMRWFAKPQAVSAINCARRGWVNVDIDTIECEACGARLLISTPQSWTQERVEKTALAFSLKLETGHKLLCPWVGNICEEGLTRFPPTQTAILVKDYKTRCSALLHLLALPVISSSAIAYMRSPQLEQFLKEHSIGEISESVETSGADHLGNEPDTVSSVLYYQAQKLISLCGWEPHPLPYTVGCKEGQNLFINDATLAETSHAVSNCQNRSISVSPLSTDESMDANDCSAGSPRLQLDPNSVVLDCRLCGAKVGLWAFSSIPRPMEFLRLSGHTEVNHTSDLDHHKAKGSGCQLASGRSRVAATDIATTGLKSLDEGPSKLNLTIAGGPPPTKQDYRAIVSLPVVGRNLRARLSSDSSIEKDHLNVNNLSKVCKYKDLLPFSGNVSREETSESSEVTSITENPSTSSQIPVQDSCDTDGVPGNEIGKTVDLGLGKQCGSVENDTCTTPADNTADISRIHSEDSTRVLAEAHNNAPCSSRENRQVELSMNDKSIPSGIDNGLEVLPSEKAMEFDPIRQHRAFCSWISSTGNSAPGWQQTLSALQRHKFSYPVPETKSSSLIEVDDPITSVRKLFTPPSSKRPKLVRPS